LGSFYQVINGATVKYILSTLFMLLGVFSQAGATQVQQVAIQCNPTGPEIQGTLETEFDLSKWATDGSCSWAGISPDGSTQDHRIPTFALSFNGLTYTNVDSSQTVTFNYPYPNGGTADHPKCDPSNIDFVTGFTLSNANTGYSIQISPVHLKNNRFYYFYFGSDGAADCTVRFK
jgi:hypothetical protein